MKKTNVYLIVAVVLVASLTLSYINFTGDAVIGVQGARGKCIDTDSGNNPETSGSVKYENRDLVYKDTCYSPRGKEETRLKEYFCVDIITSKRHHCYNGCLENENGEGYCA